MRLAHEITRSSLVVAAEEQQYRRCSNARVVLCQHPHQNVLKWQHTTGGSEARGRRRGGLDPKQSERRLL